MDIRRTFATEGFVTFYNAMAEDQISIWISMARQPGGIWYSKTLDHALEDVGRAQTLVPDEESRTISLRTRRYYKTFIPMAEANDWRWIKTFAGRENLLVRRDFSSVTSGGDLTDIGAIPGGMVVVLDHDTCFYVFGWNHSVALRFNHRLITLNKGDIFIYRGDLIIGPAGYDTNNVCLHAYLDSPMSDRLNLKLETKA